MTPEQVELLYQVSQSPFISAEQRATLKLDNPWKHQGRVAEALQRECARLNPLQARLWAKEAGASMSLAAAAAAQGLAPMTPELADEVQRMNPQTDSERRRELLERATANGNPFDKRNRYDEQGNLVNSFNLTAALELERELPDVAARLKREAEPAKPAHEFTDREAALLSMHGYQLPS